MVPTRFKAKLPRHFSYPIGAEAISEGIGEESRVESLSVGFYDHVGWSASAFRRLLAERLPSTIMAATHQPARKPGISAADWMVQDGWYGEKWELLIYPVLSESRQLANRLLRERGLPAVAQWLASSNRAGWVERSQRIELEFVPAKESLVIREISGM